MGSNAIKLNASSEINKIRNNYKINNIIHKFSLIKNLNLSRINFKETEYLQDFNQEFYQDSNLGNHKELHIYIKTFICLMSIGIILYIVKAILKCFQLKTKCNFDSTSSKKEKIKNNNIELNEDNSLSNEIVIENTE